MKILGHIKGILILCIIFTYTVLVALPLYMFYFLKLCLPFSGWRQFWTKLINKIPEVWCGLNTLVCHSFRLYDLRISGMSEPLSPDCWYFITSNHQSWADIIILQNVFNRKIPPIKFFIKHELKYFPIMNICWMALDFPFMKRYSKALLAKKPHLKGKDLETTIKMCEKYQQQPTTILNFLEGTRFTPFKHQKFQSPFQHLLPPRAGGFAYAVKAMNGKFDKLINVTLVYDKDRVTFWDLLCGNLGTVHCHIEQQDIPHELSQGDFQQDTSFREMVIDYLNRLWADKDKLISQKKAV